MSEVIRLSDEMLSDLKVFNERYLNKLKECKNDSELLNTIYLEHLNYSLNSQVGFAIRYAANKSLEE